LNVLAVEAYANPDVGRPEGLRDGRGVVRMVGAALTEDMHADLEPHLGVLREILDTELTALCVAWRLSGRELDVKAQVRELLGEWRGTRSTHLLLNLECVRSSFLEDGSTATANESLAIRSVAGSLVEGMITKICAAKQCPRRTAAVGVALAAMEHAELCLSEQVQEDPVPPAPRVGSLGAIQDTFLRGLDRIAAMTGWVYPKDAAKALVSDLDKGVTWGDAQRIQWTGIQREITDLIRSTSRSGGGSSAATSLPSWEDLGRSQAEGQVSPRFQQAWGSESGAVFVTPMEEFVASAGARPERANIAARVAVPLSFDAPDASTEAPVGELLPTQAEQPQKQRLPAGSMVQIPLKDAMQLFQLHPADEAMLRAV